MVVVAGLDAHPSAREPPNDLLIGHVDQDRGRHAPTQLGKLALKRTRLLERPREAIEDESVAGIVLLETLRRHRHDQLVGHKVAGVHVLLGLLSELRTFLDVAAEHLAG